MISFTYIYIIYILHACNHVPHLPVFFYIALSTASACVCSGPWISLIYKPATQCRTARKHTCSSLEPWSYSTWLSQLLVCTANGLGLLLAVGTRHNGYILWVPHVAAALNKLRVPTLHLNSNRNDTFDGIIAHYSRLNLLYVCYVQYTVNMFLRVLNGKERRKRTFDSK